MAKYDKPHLTFEKQLELLKSRGLTVTDEAAALNYLRRIGYYHLSAYWYGFRQKTIIPDPITKASKEVLTDSFHPKSCFQDAVRLYVFDKRMRMLVLDAIERIERAIRVDVASLLGAKDPFAQTKPEFLNGNFTKKRDSEGVSGYEKWIQKHDELIDRSKDEFVLHHKRTYGLPLPIWKSVELWDFGLLSNLYRGMQFEDKRQVAARYTITDPSVMESWLRTLNYVRNVAAHHSRLWNKNIIDQPKMPRNGVMPEFDSVRASPEAISRLYAVLYILLHFIKHICPNSSWSKRLRQLIDTFPDVPELGLHNMGFPADWRDHPHWSDTLNSPATSLAEI